MCSIVVYTTICTYIRAMEQYPNLASCDPSQCISSRILKCNRIISSIFRKHLAPFDITNSQLSILFILVKGGERTQQDLANLLFLEKSTVSRNMQRLFKNQLIAKNGTKLVYVTEVGKVFIDKVVPSWELAMEEARERLSAQGDEALTTLLTQLTS